MIKFFRKIRYDLMEKNKTGKYLKYAIGEIILVVIGILIALQINTWNENHGINKKEIKYINRLIVDLASDTTMMAEQIKRSKVSFEYGSVLDSMTRIRSRRDLPARRIINGAQHIGRVSLPQYNSNTYDDLINTGNFNIISEPKISSRIRTHYTNLPYSWNETFDQRNEELRRIIVDLMPLKFHAAILAPKSMPHLPDPKTVLNEEEAKAIVENIIDYPKINFYFKNVTRAHLFHIRLMERLKKSTINLMDVLNTYNQK